MMDKYGEVTEDYLCCLPQEKLDDLQDKLDKVFHAWLIENNQTPSFFTVENVEEVKVGQEDD